MAWTNITNGTLPDADEVMGNFDLLYDNNFIAVEAGETISAGNVCYISSSDGKAYVSDFNSTDLFVDGISIGSYTIGQTAYIQIYGIYTSSGLTAGAYYYLDSTGGISTTEGRYQIGKALTTTVLKLDIIDQGYRLLNFEDKAGATTSVSDGNTANGDWTTVSLNAGEVSEFVLIRANAAIGTDDVDNEIFIKVDTIDSGGTLTNRYSQQIEMGDSVQYQSQPDQFMANIQYKHTLTADEISNGIDIRVRITLVSSGTDKDLATNLFTSTVEGQ